MRSNYVYVIYDTATQEPLEVFVFEEDCLEKYESHYKGFVNVDVMPINIMVYKHEFIDKYFNVEEVNTDE